MAPYRLKALALLFSLTLLGFASLQHDDSDLIAWIGFYTLCALIPLLLAFNTYYRPLFYLTNLYQNRLLTIILLTTTND